MLYVTKSTRQLPNYMERAETNVIGVLKEIRAYFATVSYHRFT
jgi:hypothetical protein